MTTMIPGLQGKTPAEEEPTVAVTSRVLVIDDALPIRRALAEALGKLGVRTDDLLEATDEAEALELFATAHPHVVFTEFVGVRTEDGLEVIHEMLERDPSARIVLVTAEPRDSPEVRAAIRAGVFAYIEKPIRHEKIRAVLQELEAEEGGTRGVRARRDGRPDRRSRSTGRASQVSTPRRATRAKRRRKTTLPHSH